tara:strand:+ start:15156 stop:16670 length:1515 start_codon:yes stop_codon:yes gene_type:complete
MSKKYDYDVIVVGAGPTGMTLALSLARGGVKTLVFDKEADVYPLPRAAHVDHEIMRIYQDLGVADDIAKTCRSSLTYDFLSAKREILMQFGGLSGMGPGGWPTGNMIHQPTIERIVRDAAAGEANLELHTNWDCKSVSETADGVQASVLVNGERKTFTSRYLVAADGARSPIRNQMGIEQDDLGFDEPWLVVDVLVKDYSRLPEVNLQICDPVRPTTCVLMGSGRHRWEFMLLDGEDPQEMSSPEKVSELLEPWDVEGAVELERTAVYRFNAKVAKEWKKGRIFLAGDAAHLTPPFAGQGLCAGLRDAVNLGWKLIACLKQGADESLLETYQSERGPHARAYIELAIAQGRTVCTTDPDVAAERDAQMLAARAAGVSMTPPPPMGLVEGCLSGTTGSGSYFPQFVIEADNGMRRLDETLGRGARLIVRTSDAALSSDTGLTIVDTTNEELGEFGNRLAAWLDELRVEAVLVRPDHYVFGMGDPADLLAGWASALSGTKQAEPAV